MQITPDFGYDQIFELVRQLSPEEKERLQQELKLAEQAETRPEMTKGEYQKFLMECPVMTEEEIEEMERNIREFRNGFNRRIDNAEAWVDIEKNRQKERQLALECPVATEEEIELQDEFRRMFRCRPS